MSNTKVNLIIAAITLVVTVKLFLTAQETALWREFYVSQFVVLLTAICCSFFLRDRS